MAETAPHLPNSLEAALNAEALASALPKLAIAARLTASIVGQGAHGRRRAGQGEQFYEFRRYQSGEPAARIDWRRSARQQRLYVREQEWESRHTIYISCDFSPSMGFQSRLSEASKLGRGFHLGLSLAALALQAGERVSALSTPRPRAGKAALPNLAEELISSSGMALSKVKFKPYSDLVIFSDFLGPQDTLLQLFKDVEAARLRPVLVQIIDPVETLFPFEGHTRFVDPETSEELRFGEAQAVKERYQNAFAAHSQELHRLTLGHGGIHLKHQTDQKASYALLSLFQAIADGSKTSGGAR